MKRNLLSMMVLGAAMLFACCTPKDGDKTPGPVGNGITVTVGEVAHNQAAINIDAPADMYYYISLWSKAEIEEYAQGDAQAIADMEMQYMLDYVDTYNNATGSNETLVSFWLDAAIFQGAADLTATDLRPETEYVVLYAGVNEQGFSTPLGQTTFTTTARPAGKTIKIDPFMAAIECYGDYYGMGTNDICVYLFGETAQGYIVNLLIELSAEASNHDGVGTYTPDYDFVCAPNTYLPGTYEEGGVWGTSYMVVDYMTETVHEADIITEGTVTISKNGADYTISGTLYGDNAAYEINYTFQPSVDEETYYDDCGVGLKKAAAQMKTKRTFKVFNTKTVSAKHFNAKTLRR